MAPPTSAAPALARGLALLEDLSSAGPRSLEQLTRSHAWPKTSVLRLLQALEAAGAVVRDPASKRWLAVKRLVPDDREAGERVRLAALLARLAEDTGGTAEYWVAEGGELVLAARHEPETGEVTVRARLGFRRDLHELEATALVAVAANCQRAAGRCWRWQDGQRQAVPVAEFQRQVEAASRLGVAWDAAVNANGVVRVAAPWRSDGRLRGIVAVALAVQAWAGQPPEAVLAALRRAVA